MTDKNYGYPRILNVPAALSKMSLGGRVSRDLCYGAKVAAMKSHELFLEENGNYHDPNPYMRSERPTFNIKQSVVIPIKEEITAILPLDDENTLVGAGTRDNDLFCVNWKKAREANLEFKKNRVNPNPNTVRIAKPSTEFSVQELSKLLPRTAVMQWDGGVKGLKMNESGTLIMCSSRDAKDLTILSYDNSVKWSEDCERINEERMQKERAIYTWADGIIHGWNRNPTLPNHWNNGDEGDIEKLALYTKAGLLTRMGQGQGHTRNITGTCWYGDKEGISVGEDGYVVYWNIDETKSVEERDTWPTKMVRIKKRNRNNQNQVVRVSNRIHQTEMLSKPEERENRAKLIGIDKISGCGKIVTCTSKAKVIIMDGNNPVNSDVQTVPRKYLPIPKSKFLPETRLLVAQDVNQDTGEIVVATPSHIVLFDQRKPEPTTGVYIYDAGKVGLRNGPLTAINSGCGYIAFGHKSGNVRMLDRRTCKVIVDEKEAFNIEPSWLEDHYDNSGPFDVYPVRTIARQNHKIIAGGGPATCNGEWWSMAALTKFE